MLEIEKEWERERKELWERESLYREMFCQTITLINTLCLSRIKV